MKSPTLLFAPLALTSVLIGANFAHAQTYTPSNRIPVPDNTLGTKVLGNNNNFSITGGLQRGQGLFHSFSDFSVPTNRQANFLNPAGNRDIITRVTGGLFSDINGTVNTQGANFFLINPNGLVFGPNAQLNVGKAFVGSTANSIDLVDGGGRAVTFGTNPNGDAPLLSIDPNVFFNVSRLNMGGGSGAISNFGTLKVPNLNQYIGLIGGDVSLNGGQINASGGRVDLGGLSAFGTVTLGTDVNNLRAQFPTNVARGDVSLTNKAKVDVTGAGGGDVAINARNVEILGGSVVSGGIASGFGTSATVAGDIKVNATDNVSVDGFGSQVRNFVEQNGSGRGGNVEINSRNLSVTNSSQLSASTFGQGDAGSVKITTTGDVSIDGVKDGFRSGVFSTVGQSAKGKGGGIEIDTGNLSMTNGAVLTTSTSGQGDAGNIKITARDSVSFNNSDALNTVAGTGKGKGGDVEINTGNLSMTNGAQIQAGTFGEGDGGNIKIIAKNNVLFDGGIGTSRSTAGSSVGENAKGKGGSVEIDAGNVSVTNGALLQAFTRGQGDAGAVKITAKNTVSVDGEKDGFRSDVLSTVEPNAKGKGGGIEINTGNLSVTNRARLSASTFGGGDAGTIKITAKKDVTFDSGIAFNRVESGAKGTAGGIEIDTGNLFVINGGQLSSSIFGEGNAGNIKITAKNNVFFDGEKNGLRSAAFSTVEQNAKGKGGGIEIDAGNLSVTNNALLTTTNSGQGDAGNILLKSDRVILNQGGISSVSSAFTGGDVTVVAKNYLLLQNNSRIATDSASTGASGNGGNITINSPLIIALPGNNDITANAYQGTGGKVKIDSQGLFGIQFRPKGQESPFTNDITASSTFGQQGTVNISTPGTDPGKDKGELTAAPNDASKQIAQACGASQRDNKFYITGRGGHPPNAEDLLSSDVVWRDPRVAKTQPVASHVNSQTTRKLAPPAVGWVFDGKGKVTLIAAETEGVSTGAKVVCPKEGK
jgi:filamentous hemagglutinin family protein